jgi:DNA topoisomerase II
MVLYSMENLQRSIPSIADGLKESQRRIMFAVFHKSGSMIISRLASHVAEFTNYHHGENSLSFAIQNLAQCLFKNLNLLKGNGTFGTFLSNVCSAPRYVSVEKSKLVEEIFEVDYLDILKYDEEKIAESNVKLPEFLIAILPIVLINGAKGIGTGYSTDIPQFSLETIFEITKQILVNDLKSRKTYCHIKDEAKRAK